MAGQGPGRVPSVARSVPSFPYPFRLRQIPPSQAIAPSVVIAPLRAVGLRYEARYAPDGGWPEASVLVLWAQNNSTAAVALVGKDHRHGVRWARLFDRRFFTPRLARFRAGTRLMLDDLARRKGRMPQTLASNGGFGEVLIPTSTLIEPLGHRSGKVRLVGRVSNKTGQIYESDPVPVTWA